MIITIPGQIRGGKNNLIVLRNGMHIPKPEWKRWRDNIVVTITKQLPKSFVGFGSPLRATIRYTKGDMRRRDVPAIMDSIWHCLERAHVVCDDAIIVEVHWLDCGLDRENPSAEINLEVLG